MSRKKRARAAAAKAVKAANETEATVGVWYHPQLGARIAIDQPAHYWQVDGLPLRPWSEVARLDIVMQNKWNYTIVPGQSLPRGYLWGVPSLQRYGLSGGFLAYAPIERRCRTCKEMYTWSARAQKHLYETLGVYVDKTARHCQSCARKRRALESARARYADSLKALEQNATAAAHVTVAKDMLSILEHGGRVSIERAIGHCTRARKLGAASSVNTVEAKLRARAKASRP